MVIASSGFDEYTVDKVVWIDSIYFRYKCDAPCLQQAWGITFIRKTTLLIYFAFIASLALVTFMTPFMMRQWPGNVHTNG